MSILSGHNVVVGVTASIAAYKAAHLVRELIKAGANVQVIQTPASKEFVTPLTLSTLSKNPVLTDFTKEADDSVWNNHVELGLWADIILIAPATAKTLSKMANGECDNFLLTTYLSARCPVFFAPAMDLDMYRHPSTQENIAKLTAFGNTLIPPGEGELASGLTGKGRMAEPEDIVSFMNDKLSGKLPLSGQKVLITAGPTYESIDPVRFIGNHSSGKMGFALAEAAAKQGAQVTLVSGPSNQQVNHPFVKRIDVTSAEEMYTACHTFFDTTNIAILSAAVADYKPSDVAKNKIKKATAEMQINLVPTKDILHTLGEKKKEGQLLVGFALETENEDEHAQQKLVRKNLDFIVLNSLNDQGAGFQHDTNKVSILDKSNKFHRFELKSKQAVARDIINQLIAAL